MLTIEAEVEENRRQQKEMKKSLQFVYQMAAMSAPAVPRKNKTLKVLYKVFMSICPIYSNHYGATLPFFTNAEWVRGIS